MNIENAEVKDRQEIHANHHCFLGPLIAFCGELGTFSCYRRKQHPAGRALISVAEISISISRNGTQ